MEHIRGRLTYEQAFYRVLGGDNRPGEIYGWPFPKGPYCNSDVKMPPLDKIERGNITYVGIAVDEPNQFHTLSDTKKSPLVEDGWTEAMCREWCEKNDLLSPIYTTATRGVLVLPQSERKPTAAPSPQLPGILGADAQMGCRQPGYISRGRPHRPRLRPAVPDGGRWPDLTGRQSVPLDDAGCGTKLQD